MDTEIKTKSITLSELFAMPLKIPEYQRPYEWGPAQVDKLLAQVRQHRDTVTEAKPLFYLGSIVLHHDTDNNYNIIDGQQRITTFALIAHIRQVESVNYDLSYDNLISQQTIRNNYKHLSGKTAELNILSFDAINITVIITPSQDEAYNFFETLNTGGVRLTGTQIIKAHHLRSVPNQKAAFYAILWEKNEKYIEQVVKLLLKIRMLSAMNYKEPPLRNSGDGVWKTLITEQFSEQTLKGNIDDAYTAWTKNNNCYKQLGNVYALRQPLHNGENFINYLLSYVAVYRQLFMNRTDRGEAYLNFRDRVINHIDGTVDLKMLYELGLMCYAGKFGLDKMEAVSFWIFRFVYSLRVTEPNRVTEKGVINHNTKHHFIDRILYTHSEDEVLHWLKAFKYTPNNENFTTGVKGRFVDRVLHEEKFHEKDGLAGYDNALIEKYGK